MFGFDEAAVSALFIAAAFTRPLLTFLGLVRTRCLGHDAFAAASGAVTTGT